MRHIIKTTVIYLALVIPPFLGLVGIVQLGKGLAAPPSIGGEWQLDDASQKEAAVPTVLCHDLVFDKQPTWKVSQSGLRAQLVFADKAKTVMNVQIDDHHITGSGHAPGAGGCDEPLSLDARLEKSGDKAEIVGTLERRGCSSCPALHIRASKKPPTATP
jgi:hypothetical protein